MSSTIALKRRITSVRSTRQITKAMELVAASRMRKSQESARAGRAYQEAAYSLLRRLNEVTEVTIHPLFEKRTIHARAYIVISSNRGLAGAYNANVLRELTKRIRSDASEHVASKVIAVGSRAAHFVRRLKDAELTASYPAFDEAPSVNALRPILSMAIEMFLEDEADEIVLIYTKFISNISQEVIGLSVLPARYDEKDGEKDVSLRAITFEPSVEDVLENVTERLIEAQLWQAILEGSASEQSMRMMAMKNATDNANELIDDLTLAFNSIRQSVITQELAEITGGSEAMKEAI